MKTLACIRNKELSVSLSANKVLALGRGESNFGVIDKRYLPRVERVVINDMCISATHCYIWIVQFDSTLDGVCYLQDVSRNGTFVNGVVVGEGRYTILRDGDIVGIGEHTFEFEMIDAVQRCSVPKRIGNWSILDDVIGIGTFGKVQIAINNKNKGFYAVKRIKKSTSKGAQAEYSLLRRLKHDNIVKVTDDADIDNCIFQELAIGGDLFSYLSQEGSEEGSTLHGLPEPEAIFALFQICQGLLYLHKNGIVHRDLKLDNIFVMDAPINYPRLAIGDFGIARDTKECNGRMQTMVGTAEYAAPEIQLPRESKSNHIIANITSITANTYTSKVDVWSVGVIAHILFTGISPFYGSTLEEMRARTERGVGGLTHWRNGTSPTGQAFVLQTLAVDARERPSAEELVQHSVFGGGGRSAIMTRMKRNA